MEHIEETESILLKVEEPMERSEMENLDYDEGKVRAKEQFGTITAKTPMLQKQSTINKQLQLEAPVVLRQNNDVENRNANICTRRGRLVKHPYRQNL